MQIAGTQSHALSFLRRSLGDRTATFREGQWEAIEALVERRARLLVVQRIGWGKSLVYFMASHLLTQRGAGPTLLVSPLRALMRNQIQAARRFGIRAETINSSNYREWQPIAGRVRAGQVDLLIISPERFANETFRNQILRSLASRTGLLAVDEAHCISDCGARFPTELLPDRGRAGSTASCRAPGGDNGDGQQPCDRGCAGAARSGDRGHAWPAGARKPALQNIPLPGQSDRLAWLAEQVPRLPGSGIIYALTVADALQVARWLQLCGIKVHAYYSSLATDRREALERQLLNNELKALVATPALGMGFDKPNLHFVIHFHRPGSAIHYYQQVGRAGRVLDEAFGILLDGGDEDREITDYFVRTAFPLDTYLDQVLDALWQARVNTRLASRNRRDEAT